MSNICRTGRVVTIMEAFVKLGVIFVELSDIFVKLSFTFLHLMTGD